MIRNIYPLIAQKNGSDYYFTASQWNEIKDKSTYEKIGILVNDASCPAFCVALEDKDESKTMTWDEAVNLYSEDAFPSEIQCHALAENWDNINESIKTFGGVEVPKDSVWYWGKEYNSSQAWILSFNGNILYGTKKAKCRVRAVTPLH